MLIIDPEFQSLIPPLAPEELAQLEANILADGCRDPLVVWECPDEFTNPEYVAAAKNGDKAHCKYCRKDVTVSYGDAVIKCDGCGSGLSPNRYESILIDGHNRHAICTKHGLPFETVGKEFEDREAAMDWMDANQLGRRNLKPDQFTLLLGRRYNRRKKGVGKPGGTILGQNEPISTAAKLAQEHGVDESTVRRAGQYAAAVDNLKDSAQRIRARAIRRCGELWKEVEKSKGGRPEKTKDGEGPSLTPRQEMAEKVGMSERQVKTATAPCTMLHMKKARNYMGPCRNSLTVRGPAATQKT